ncbi:MAG TPA: hypothetical protein VN026_04000 [Bacteroidia bacterium]|nr:hypothetical protein [Bacteroidia bacterium]
MKAVNSIRGKVMKVTALVALTLGSFLLKANNINGAGETEKTIKEHVKFPNLILPIKQTEKVEVVFTTSENGKVNFVFAKTDNKEIKADIEKQFSQLTLTKLKANVAYSIVLNLKTI